MTGRVRKTVGRQGVAAVEFAVCMPLLVTLMLGLWEVGRMTEVSNVMWNGAREAARDSSLGQDNLQTVANNLLAYLQSAEPTVFHPGHTTVLQTPTVTLAANTTGWTCMDTSVTPNQELFTITFTDVSTPATTDPTGMAKLDIYTIGVQVPYSTLGWTTVAKVTGITRVFVSVTWACMLDAPFQITPYLPAQ